MKAQQKQHKYTIITETPVQDLTGRKTESLINCHSFAREANEA